MTIQQYYEKAKAIDIRALALEVMKEQSSNIIFLNQYQLFNYGEDREGEPLLLRSISYSLYKKTKNPNLGFGKADLKDTGDFYSKFYVNIDKDSFEVHSSDSKTNSLVDRFGEKIFGLSEENINVFREQFFSNEFFSKIKSALS